MRIAVLLGASFLLLSSPAVGYDEINENGLQTSVETLGPHLPDGQGPWTAVALCNIDFRDSIKIFQISGIKIDPAYIWATSETNRWWVVIKDEGRGTTVAFLAQPGNELQPGVCGWFYIWNPTATQFVVGGYFASGLALGQFGKILVPSL